MMVDVLLPGLDGDETTLFTVERWMCRVGLSVREGEPLVQVRSGTTLHLVPAPAGGLLVQIRVQEGSQARAGAVLATLDK